MTKSKTAVKNADEFERLNSKRGEQMKTDYEIVACALHLRQILFLHLYYIPYYGK